MRNVHYSLLGVAIGALLYIFQSSTQAQEYSWSAVYSLIENRFPQVPAVDISTLETWLQSTDVLIIDVRTREEYLVSHLIGAKNRVTVEGFQHIPKDRRMVLYCSVGYRSAKLVQLLQKEGYTQVYNMKGSIFAWANAGKPVYRRGEKTTFVHPYNDVWGQLLYKKYHPPLLNQER